MKNTKLFIEFSEEMEQFIFENKIDIGDVLRQNNIDAEIQHEQRPYGEDVGARSKNVVLVILASSAALIAVGVTLSQVIKTIYRKPFFREYYEIVEIRDEKGKIVFDKNGNPLFKPELKHRLLEPRKEDAYKEFEINWNIDNGLIIKFSSSEKQSTGESSE